MLTAGNVGDIEGEAALLKRAGRMRYLLADKGYDSGPLRPVLRDSAVPVIHARRNRKRTIRYNKLRHRGRHPIKYALRGLKDFRRVAAHNDTLVGNFLVGPAIATALAFWL